MAKKITINLSNELTIEEGLEQFIRKCKVKNLTENTIKSYISKDRKFIEFVGGNDTPVKAVNKDTIDSYILWMRERGDASATINSYLRAVRSLLYFLMDNGSLNRFTVNLVKEEQKIKETYTEAELDLLLKKPNLKKVSFNEYKTWVLENYLLGTGNRISTALDIQIRDVDLSNGIITLRKTKNRTQQLIPITPSLVTILDEYIGIRGGAADDYLFCNSYGNKANIRTIQQMVADYNTKRGVTKTSCHLFRHTFAKMYILNGGDAFRLQKLMGHSDIAVTKVYVNMFGADLAVDYDRFNPLETIATQKAKIKL